MEATLRIGTRPSRVRLVRQVARDVYEVPLAVRAAGGQMLLKYDFDEKCRGGRVRVAKTQCSTTAIRIEPDIGMAWECSLQHWEAMSVADILEGGRSSMSPIRIGLDDIHVRRTVSGAEISVTGVMVGSKVVVQLDHGQASRLAQYIRPSTPPVPKWNAGVDRRRDRLMKGVFG